MLVGSESVLYVLWAHGNNELPCIVISRTSIRFGSLKKGGGGGTSTNMNGSHK